MTHASRDIVQGYADAAIGALKAHAEECGHSSELSIDASKRALVAILVTLVQLPDEDQRLTIDDQLLIDKFMKLCGYEQEQVN